MIEGGSDGRDQVVTVNFGCGIDGDGGTLCTAGGGKLKEREEGRVEFCLWWRCRLFSEV